MRVDIGEDLVHLGMVGGRLFLFFISRGASALKGLVQKYHQLQEDSLIQDVFPEPSIGGQLVNIIDKARLLLLGQAHPVGHLCIPEQKTAGQICGIGGEPFQIFRIDGQDDPLMLLLIDLGQIMAFEFIDHEDISVFDVIEAVVDQELLPS